MCGEKEIEKLSDGFFCCNFISDRYNVVLSMEESLGGFFFQERAVIDADGKW